MLGVWTRSLSDITLVLWLVFFFSWDSGKHLFLPRALIIYQWIANPVEWHKLVTIFTVLLIFF